MKIILDTNFLMSISQFGIDIFSQLRGNDLFTIEPVIRELKSFEKGDSKKARAAKLALEIIKSKHLKVLKSKETSADKSLITYSSKGYTIATQDIELRKKIKEAGGQAIYIRQRKYVII